MTELGESPMVTLGQARAVDARCPRVLTLLALAAEELDQHYQRALDEWDLRSQERQDFLDGAKQTLAVMHFYLDNVPGVSIPLAGLAGGGRAPS